MTDEEKLHEQIKEILTEIAKRSGKYPDALWFAEEGSWKTHNEFAKNLFNEGWLWAFDERVYEFLWWYFDKQQLDAIAIYKLFIEYANEKHPKIDNT